MQQINKSLKDTVVYYKEENSRIKALNMELEKKFVQAESLWMTYKSIIDDIDVIDNRKEFNLVLEQVYNKVINKARIICILHFPLDTKTFLKRCCKGEHCS